MELTRRKFIRAMCMGTASLLVKACGRADDSQRVREKPEPAYLKLEREGELEKRIEQAVARMAACDLCPHRCGVNRLKGQRGFCNAPDKAIVNSYNPHFGEEAPLVGRNGSGTVFFSNCNLRCVFCQNWPIAHEGRGRSVDDEALADIMLNLQRRGCHNINLVTPTHVLPNILAAVRIALKKGLRLPLCYNTGGYESPEIVRMLDGIMDIYLPDLKFMDGEEADRYVFTGASDYPKMARESIKEMHRQVGDLVTDDNGVALRGLMIRHLVMPNRVAGTGEFVKWVAEKLSTGTYVNIMSQYRVAHKAFDYERIARAITRDEFAEALAWAKEAGLTNLDSRSTSRLESFQRLFR